MSKEFTPVNLSLPTIGAVICAAGKGTRTGFEKNKLLVAFNGSTALEQSIDAFNYHAISQIVVTASKDDYDEIKTICDKYARTTVVLGGDTRTGSVYNALQAMQTDVVLIHDGARPYVSREVINACIDCVKGNGSGITAIPCTDTVAVANEQGKIVSVPNRDTLYALQTPQGFFIQEILSAYKRAFEDGNTQFTDDSSLFSAYAHAPTLCAGARDNIKVTYAQDFEKKTERVGFGVDTHAFGKEQDYITLCGVKVPSKSGLIAHSDGDVAIHALMDGMLSACGLRDIGYYFPDTDEQYKGADSTCLLEKVNEKIHTAGYRVKNISLAIQAEKPRLSKYVDTMKEALATILALPINAVGITVGTNEGLGYVGEGKGITVYAYVLLSEK